MGRREGRDGGRGGRDKLPVVYIHYTYQPVVWDADELPVVYTHYTYQPVVWDVDKLPVVYTHYTYQPVVCGELCTEHAPKCSHINYLHGCQGKVQLKWKKIVCYQPPICKVIPVLLLPWQPVLGHVTLTAHQK